MGSWSEACGFSGLEIADGEVAYVMLMDKTKHGSLNDGAYQHWSPTTTLLRGTYNDYGQLLVEEDEAILEIFNERSGLALKNGDNFSLSDLDGKPVDRWWMHGSMFDFMGTIKQDFPYVWTGEKEHVRVKNVGEAADVKFDHIVQAVEKAVEKAKELRERLKDGELAIELALNQMEVREALFGYTSTPALGRDRLYERIAAGEDFKPQLDAYKRVWILSYAMGELRKVLHPCESAGPQHGGEIALDQFALHLRRTIRERKKRWN